MRRPTSHRVRRRGATVLAAVLTLGLLPGTSAAAPVTCRPPAAGTTGVMLVGDSVTDGASGDWTWRLRLSRHLDAHRSGVDLVGPRADLALIGDAAARDDRYADPGFDRDHAARWGESRGNARESLADLVTACGPDVVVEALGFNDLFFGGAEPAALADLAAQRVADARAVDPDVDVVLVELFQVWHANVPAYNAELARVVAAADTPRSRVVLARVAAGATEEVDSYDRIHPSATGEVRIAAGVADALAELGVGAPYARPLPVLPRGPNAVARLSAERGETEAWFTWTYPPDSTAESLLVREAGTETWHEPWVLVRGQGHVGGLHPDRTYEARLQSHKWSTRADRSSNVVRLVPRPQRVTGLQVRASDRRLAVSWRADPRASAYRVTWREGRGVARTRTVTGTRTVLGVPAGRRFSVFVASVNERGRGPAVSASAVTPPPPVTRLVVRHDGRRRLVVRWRELDRAAVYRVTWRARGVPVRVRTTRAEAVRLTGLVAGRRYTVTVQPVLNGLTGPTRSVAAVPRR